MFSLAAILLKHTRGDVTHRQHFQQHLHPILLPHPNNDLPPTLQQDAKHFARVLLVAIVFLPLHSLEQPRKQRRLADYLGREGREEREEVFEHAENGEYTLGVGRLGFVQAGKVGCEEVEQGVVELIVSCD
jgi:hypothetical protein